MQAEGDDAGAGYGATPQHEQADPHASAPQPLPPTYARVTLSNALTGRTRTIFMSERATLDDLSHAVYATLKILPPLQQFMLGARTLAPGLLGPQGVAEGTTITLIPRLRHSSPDGCATVYRHDSGLSSQLTSFEAAMLMRIGLTDAYVEAAQRSGQDVIVVHHDFGPQSITLFESTQTLATRVAQARNDSVIAVSNAIAFAKSLMDIDDVRTRPARVRIAQNMIAFADAVCALLCQGAPAPEPPPEDAPSDAGASRAPVAIAETVGTSDDAAKGRVQPLRRAIREPTDDELRAKVASVRAGLQRCARAHGVMSDDV